MHFHSFCCAIITLDEFNQEPLFRKIYNHIMAENNPQLLIGAHGWMHSQWGGTFYPDDLPEDWQLGYYANEFSLVVIEQKAWAFLHENPDIITDWIAETESGLRFVCEISVDCSEQEENVYLSVVHKLGDACVGVILVGYNNWHDDSLVSAILNKLPVDVPCIIDFTELPDSVVLQGWQQQYPLSICWRIISDTNESSFKKISAINKHVMVAVRIQSGLLTLKQLRGVIETVCNNSGADNNILLIVDGDPPDVELMRNAQLIYDML